MIYRQNFTFYQKKTGFALFDGIRAWRFVPMTALALALCFMASAWQMAQADEGKILNLKQAHDTVFPEEVLVTDDGAGFAMAAQDNAVIVNFWASWCAPCVHELPALAKAAEILKEGDMPIDVVLISVDRKGADHAQNFLDERGISGVVSAYNPTSTWPRALGLSGLPSTYVISRDKSKIYLLHGPATWDDAAVLAEVQAAIAP